MAETSVLGEGIIKGGGGEFNNVAMEAVQALRSLGFRDKDAKEAVAKIQKEGQNTDLSGLIKHSRRVLKS